MYRYIIFERKDHMNTALIILAIVAYLAFTVYIGFRCSKKNKSTDDFYLGGRQLGPLVTAMSAEASDMSSWLLMGLPGVALLTGYLGNTTGFAEAVWTAVGLAVGTYLNWLIVAKRLRRYTERTNAVTLPDFFSNRFGDKKGLLCAIAAVIIVLFFVPYTGSGFAAVGKLFNSFFGVNYHVALIVGAAVIAAYTILGGFLAASTTDFIQSIVMTIALVVVVVFGFVNAGEGVLSIEQHFSNINFGLMGTDGTSYGILPIISTLAWGLGYFGMPHILLRFMAIEDDRKLSLSRRVASIWVVISMGIAILIGVIGFNYAFNNGLLKPGFDSENIIVYMAKGLSEINWLLAIVAGLILSGILASIMSTSDSQMLAAGSAISENIVARFSKKRLPAKTQMWVARGTVLLVSLIGVVLAWNPESSVFRIVSFAWAGFGATFGPLVLFSLFWKRTNKWGALAGMITGAVTVLAWKFLVRPLGGAWDLYELLPAFVLSALAIAVVSLLTPAPEKEITDTFDEIAAGMKN